ncbi:MAG TPA: hypothetical protein VMH77_09635 [Steroidobacteraceae bacterium]|nr:hypothetical protein [Steroidobacteraceae bacterium]
MSARGVKGLMGWLVVLAPHFPIAALAAETPASPPDEQLDEVLVEGAKPEGHPEKLIEWLTRLVGQFVVEGSVDLRDRDEAQGPIQVQGHSNCVGLYPTQAVQCELKLRWSEAKGLQGEGLPGGILHLDPAIMLFGYEGDHVGIRHMLVGNDGIAETALGYLIEGDTLVSRDKCVNVPGHCERVVRITADSDLELIEMKIDLEVEHQKTLSFMFVMHRTQESK